MKKQLFRQKSINKISSPEQLNDYVRVSNPGVWMILISIIILLAGLCVWGIFGRLDTTLTVSAVSKNGVIVCYLPEAYGQSVKQGMTAEIDGKKFGISEISSRPVQVTEDFDAYALHIGDIEVGDWVYEAYTENFVPDGVYEAKIITESIAPMSFLFNQG